MGNQRSDVRASVSDLYKWGIQTARCEMRVSLMIGYVDRQLTLGHGGSPLTTDPGHGLSVIRSDG